MSGWDRSVSTLKQPALLWSLLMSVCGYSGRNVKQKLRVCIHTYTPQILRGSQLHLNAKMGKSSLAFTLLDPQLIN